LNDASVLAPDLNLRGPLDDEYSMQPARQSWRPLGELLVEAGCLTATQLERALDVQQRTGHRLGTVLVDLQLVGQDDLERVLMEQMGFDLSTQKGFGSGLRDQLARRGVSATRSESRPVSHLSVLSALPEPTQGDGRRGLFGRRRSRQEQGPSTDRLREALVEFDRTTRALEESLVEVRRVLGD
jgi:hypothetical protein